MIIVQPSRPQSSDRIAGRGACHYARRARTEFTRADFGEPLSGLCFFLRSTLANCVLRFINETFAVQMGFRAVQRMSLGIG